MTKRTPTRRDPDSDPPPPIPDEVPPAFDDEPTEDVPVEPEPAPAPAAAPLEGPTYMRCGMCGLYKHPHDFWSGNTCFDCRGT